MSNLLKSKFLVGFVVASVMLAGFVATFSVAKIASAANCIELTIDLKEGMSNSQVTCLQQMLNEKGYTVSATGAGSPGYESMYFGAKTKLAVMAFQADKGISPVAGYVGPVTRAALNAASSMGGVTFPAGCSSASGFSSTTGQPCTAIVSSFPAGCSSNSGFSTTTGQSCAGASLPAGCTSTAGFSPLTGVSCAGGTPSTPSSPLAGLAGTVSFNSLSQYSNEEVGAGVNGIKIYSFELEASDGDVGLKHFKLTFDATGNATGDSDRLEDYLSTVTILQGSTEIGSSSTLDFTRDSTGVYSKNIPVSNAVVRDGDTEKFYVVVDAANNIDSADIDSDSWTVDVINVRYEDGSGVVSTDTITLTPVGISFVTSNSASDTELSITVDSTLKAGVQTVNTTSDTEGVLLLKGTFKVEGSSDVWLDEVPFLFTTNATNADAVAGTVYLTLNGTEFSESMGSAVGTTEVITFNELDMTLAPGSYTFTVTADVNDIEDSTFDEGDYLKADLDSTRRALIIVQNEQGDQLTDATEMTGVASGTEQYFYSISPTVTVVSKSIESVLINNYPSAATAKLKLAITANGGTLYLNGEDETTQAKEFFGIALDGGDASSAISVTGYTFTPSGTYTVTNSGSDDEYYTLNEGDTMYVDIEATITQATGSSGVLVGMKGDEILFGTASTSDTTRSANALSFTALTDILKTGKTTLSK